MRYITLKKLYTIPSRNTEDSTVSIVCVRPDDEQPVINCWFDESYSAHRMSTLSSFLESVWRGCSTGEEKLGAIKSEIERILQRVSEKNEYASALECFFYHVRYFYENPSPLVVEGTVARYNRVAKKLLSYREEIEKHFLLDQEEPQSSSELKTYRRTGNGNGKSVSPQALMLSSESELDFEISMQTRNFRKRERVDQASGIDVKRRKKIEHTGLFIRKIGEDRVYYLPSLRGFVKNNKIINNHYHAHPEYDEQKSQNLQAIINTFESDLHDVPPVDRLTEVKAFFDVAEKTLKNSETDLSRTHEFLGLKGEINEAIRADWLSKMRAFLSYQNLVISHFKKAKY